MNPLTPFQKRVLSFVALGLMASLFAGFVLSLEETRSVRENDLPAYYDAGQLVSQGRSDLLYDRSFRPSRNKFTNLPVVSLLFVPLGELDYAVAWQLFWWLQVLSYGATLALLLFAVQRYFPPLTPARAAWVVTVAFVFAPVFRRCLALGQTTPMMVLLFAIFYLLQRSGRTGVAGVALGTICVIKIPPLLILPVLALRRRFLPVLIALGMLTAAVFLSGLIFGVDVLGAYARHVIFDNAGGAIATFNNQSLDGALMRLLSDKSLVDWIPTPRPLIVTLAGLAVLATIGGLLLRVGWPLVLPRETPRDDDRRRGGLELELGLAVALMLLAFPVVWIHYYLFLLVPLTLLPFWWEQRGLARAPWMIAAFALGVWLCGSGEVFSNAYYEASQAEPLFRLAESQRPLGALLLVACMVAGVAELARRPDAPDA